MKWLLISFVLLLSALTLKPCEYCRQLKQITLTLRFLSIRIDTNNMFPPDGVTSGITLNNYETIKDNLCDGGKRYAKRSTIPLIKKILAYFGEE